MYDEPYIQPNTMTPPQDDCDQRMTRLMNMLKGDEQSALDRQTHIIDEIKDIAEKTDREDIRECLAEVTEKIKHDENEHWEIAAKWGSHFENLMADIEGESDNDEQGDETDEDDTDEVDDDEDSE